MNVTEDNKMNNKYYLMILVLVVSVLHGCGSAVMGTIPSYNASSVNVTDNRKAADKVRYRDSVLSAIVFFGDDSLQPNLKDYFVGKVAGAKPAGLSKLNIVINKFRMADYFPKRMSAGVADWVYMPNTDTKMVARNELPTDVDMIICYFDGVVNGEKITAKSVFPYTLNGGSAMIYSDANFVKAINGSIDHVVTSIYKQLEQ